MCRSEIDNQEHILKCDVLKTVVPKIYKTKVKYEHIFGGKMNFLCSKIITKTDNEERKSSTSIFVKILFLKYAKFTKFIIPRSTTLLIVLLQNQQMLNLMILVGLNY